MRSNSQILAFSDENEEASTARKIWAGIGADNSGKKISPEEKRKKYNRRSYSIIGGTKKPILYSTD